MLDMLHVDEDDMLARVSRASDVSEIMRSPSVALGAGKTSHLFDLSESREIRMKQGYVAWMAMS